MQEVTEVLLRCGDSHGFIGHADVNDTIAGLCVDVADGGGLDAAEAPAFDHCGAGHPDVRVLRGDDDVAATQQGGVAGEAVSRGDTDEWDETRQRTEKGKRHAVHSRDAMRVGIARPATATFGEENERKA